MDCIEYDVSLERLLYVLCCGVGTKLESHRVKNVYCKSYRKYYIGRLS